MTKVKEESRVAIVYEWFFRMAGGERVIDALCEMYPNADIYVLFGSEKQLLENIKGKKIYYSFLQKVPFIKSFYRYTYFLWPSAIETFKFEGYDLVLSVNHCVAKGVIVPESIPHLSYIFTPMRYAWDMSHEYFNRQNFSFLKRLGINLFLPYLRSWDYYSSKRLDKVAVISEFAGERVKKYYKVDYGCIVHPPVDTHKALYNEKTGVYYVSIAPFEPNKYGDVIVEAAKHFGFKLKLIGDGSMRKKLQKSCKGFGNIEFLGTISERKKFEILSRAMGLITMGVEDFGIAPVEAQACGVPVIGLSAGGTKETVLDNSTGILIQNRTVEGIGRAVEDLELKLSMNFFDRKFIVKNAEKFSRERFIKEMREWIEKNI